MERIKLHVRGNQIAITERPEIITAGTVGLDVEFVFDSQWNRLSKTVLFRAGDKVIAAALEKSVHTVPWEILSKPNLWLSIGVYGADAKGTVVIPTCWLKVAAIYTGVDPNGDTALEPTNPIWRQALAQVETFAPELQNHIRNASGYNPHGITCAQIGAAENALVEERFNTLDGAISDLDNRLGDAEAAAESGKLHLADKNNPHGVSCEQIGAIYWEDFPFLVQEYLNSGDSGVTDHMIDKSNPHKVTCEQIGAAKKEDVTALVVTVNGTTPSHTNQEIFDKVANGGSVYLKMWTGTYIRLSWCTATEALFEASLVNAITGADGNSYPVQNFRTYRIVNNKYQANSAIVPSQAYVDAMVQYYLNQ